MTNQFQKMMDEALKATKKVLEQRQKDLSEKGWNADKQNEFFKIFGINGSDVITVDSRKEREKVRKIRKNDKASENLPPMDPYIEVRDDITAYIYMRDGVGRLLDMCTKISVTSPIDSSQRIHGNFVNQTDINDGSANVSGDQTLGLNSDSYKNILKINIQQNFVCKPLMGYDSQASTLCHELSHFFRSQDGKHGGLGTDDMPVSGGFSKNKPYNSNASDLKSSGNQDVFKNSYNIEKYFELIIVE
ncbi:hypothetical protein [Buttiauxella sp.]|uniref:hypothetical protein n=1 Tax=Buttiauxella sp. TaxID=1972222 RepID=UPI003C75AA10